jgi:hypothetical protein
MSAAIRMQAPPPLVREIEECRRHAAHCANKAKLAQQAEAREDFLRLEKSWLQLARSYEFAQGLLAGAPEGSPQDNKPDDKPDNQKTPLSGLH